MRAALWFLALFGTAVAIALFAGNNQGTVTLFWPPYRMDLSLNLVLVLLGLAFFLLYVALRSLAILFAIPKHARRWRVQHQEQAVHMALVDALSHFIAGRFIRAKKAAQTVLTQERLMAGGGETLQYSGRLRALAHLLAAESAQVLQDKTQRESHFRQSLEQLAHRDGQEAREGLQLRAARWALEDRDPEAALAWLNELPQGAARRTVALRLRLKAARLAGQTRQALETARLLAKHGAFSELAALRILRGLALELVAAARDPQQVRTVWLELDEAEQLMPDVAAAACARLVRLGGDGECALSWLLPVWEIMSREPAALTDEQRIGVVRAFDAAFSAASGAQQASWLTRIEQAHLARPADAVLQYLAGMACMRRQLWGKAQQLLQQALPRLQNAALERSAWAALAELAERREEPGAATQAWKRAGQIGADLGAV